MRSSAAAAAAAANQLLSYGGYSSSARDYDPSATYNYCNLSAGALMTYGAVPAGYVDGTTLYNRHCDYTNSAAYSADCVNQSTLGKAKRRAATSSVTSSPPTNHGADTCYYKKQRLVAGAGYSYGVTTTSSCPSSAAAAGPYSHAYDVINQA